jgi:hypothetical protein
VHVGGILVVPQGSACSAEHGESPIQQARQEFGQSIRPYAQQLPRVDLPFLNFFVPAIWNFTWDAHGESPKRIALVMQLETVAPVSHATDALHRPSVESVRPGGKLWSTLSALH